MILFARFRFKLFAKLTDKHAQILWLVGRLRSPHRSEQRSMRNHLAGMAREVKQQFKFLRRQVDWLALRPRRCAPRHRSRNRLHQSRSRALRCAAHMSANAGQQFLDAERLGDVIIRTGVESLNFGALMIAHR